MRSATTRVAANVAALVFASLLVMSCSSTTAERLDVRALVDDGGVSVPSASGRAGRDSSLGSPTEGGLGDGGSGDARGQQGGGSAGGAGRRAAGVVAGGASEGGAPALDPPVLKVGLQVSTNAGTGLAAIGASGTGGQGDPRDLARAVIDWMNANGGVAGRPVEPVFNDVDAVGSAAAASERACAQWTQDERVSVANPVSAVQDSNLLRDCLGRAGIPSYYGNVYSQLQKSSFDGSPLWFELFGTNLEDLARVTVRGLAAQQFFDEGKVGVVYHDSPSFREELESTFLPELAAVGVTPETFAASASSAADAGAGSQQMSNAVLRFRSAGVDKVLFFEPWAGFFLFLSSAESQGYRPTYGFTSQAGLSPMIELGLVPTSQLPGSRLVGWLPLTDVDDAAPYVGPRLSLCVDIYRQAGIPMSSANYGRAVQLMQCDHLLLLRDVYRNAPATLTGDHFRVGMEVLGADTGLGSAPMATFGPDKHWGAAGYWPGHYEESCTCYVYDGPWRPAP